MKRKRGIVRGGGTGGIGGGRGRVGRRGRRKGMRNQKIQNDLLRKKPVLYPNCEISKEEILAKAITKEELVILKKGREIRNKIINSQFFFDMENNVNNEFEGIELTDKYFPDELIMKTKKKELKKLVKPTVNTLNFEEGVVENVEPNPEEDVEEEEEEINDFGHLNLNQDDELYGDDETTEKESSNHEINDITI